MSPGSDIAGDVARLRVLSLGAGVQSTTLALMAAHGEIDMPDVAIFADTHWEPKAVYDHLNWLRSSNVLPYAVNIVSQGDIRQSIRDRRNTTGGRFAPIPWHGTLPNGKTAMGRRQCSSEYKLTPIMHEIRRLLGKGPRDRIRKGAVESDDRHLQRRSAAHEAGAPAVHGQPLSVD